MDRHLKCVAATLALNVFGHLELLFSFRRSDMKAMDISVAANIIVDAIGVAMGGEVTDRIVVDCYGKKLTVIGYCWVRHCFFSKL